MSGNDGITTAHQVAVCQWRRWGTRSDLVNTPSLPPLERKTEHKPWWFKLIHFILQPEQAWMWARSVTLGLLMGRTWYIAGGKCLPSRTFVLSFSPSVIYQSYCALYPTIFISKTGHIQHLQNHPSLEPVKPVYRTLSSCTVVWALLIHRYLSF